MTLLFEEPKEQEGKKIEEGDESADLSGMRVLLAEDNELNMEIAETFLTDAGVQITKAYNGKEEVERYLEQPAGTFDAILTDLMMPVMDGYEAVREIRSSGRADAQSIPIIALTANALSLIHILSDRSLSIFWGMRSNIRMPADMSCVR